MVNLLRKLVVFAAAAAVLAATGSQVPAMNRMEADGGGTVNRACAQFAAAGAQETLHVDESLAPEVDDTQSLQSLLSESEAQLLPESGEQAQKESRQDGSSVSDGQQESAADQQAQGDGQSESAETISEDPDSGEQTQDAAGQLIDGQEGSSFIYVPEAAAPVSGLRRAGSSVQAVLEYWRSAVPQGSALGDIFRDGRNMDHLAFLTMKTGGQWYTAYCLRHNADVQGGDSYTQGSPLTDPQKKELVGRVLLFGVHDSMAASGANAEHASAWYGDDDAAMTRLGRYTASQVMIWLVTTDGFSSVDENGNFTLNSSALDAARKICAKSRHGSKETAWQYFEDLYECMRSFKRVPDFAGVSSTSAPDHMMNYKDGSWDIALKDGNTKAGGIGNAVFTGHMLSDKTYKIDTGSLPAGVTAEIKGNVLNVRSSRYYKDGITIRLTRQQKQADKAVRGWICQTHQNYQPVGTFVSPAVGTLACYVRLSMPKEQEKIISTKARDSLTGQQISAAADNTELVDEVSYSGFMPGETYVMEARLIDPDTGSEWLDPDGKAVTARKEFTPSQGKGSIEISLIFDASEIKGAEDLVIFESAYYQGSKICSHEDLHDQEQTIHFPSVGTCLLDRKSGSHICLAGDKAVLEDRVDYKNLLPGLSYTITGRLIDRQTGQALKDEQGREIMVSRTFQPAAADGSLTIPFEIDASGLYSKQVTAFESLLLDGHELASHEDPGDEEQSVHFTGPASVSIYKYDSSDRKPLAGAAFSILTTDRKKVIDIDGKEIAQAVTDADGNIYFQRLPYGTYIITETKAPKGMQLPAEPITVTVPAQMSEDQHLEKKDAEGDLHDEKNKIWYVFNLHYDIGNAPQLTLPRTGKAVLLYPGLVCTFAAAGFALYAAADRKKRKHSGDQPR